MYYLVSLEIAGEVERLDAFLLAGELDADRLAIEVNARIGQVQNAEDLSITVSPIELMPLRPGHTVAQTVNARVVPTAERFGAQIRRMQQEIAESEAAEAAFPDAPF